MRDIGGKVSFLIIRDPFQGRQSIQNWLGQNADDQQPHLVNGQSRGLFLEQATYPDQEEMGERGEEHVMMPAQPTAGFIVVEAHLAFAFFKESLNGPA